MGHIRSRVSDVTRRRDATPEANMWQSIRKVVRTDRQGQLSERPSTSAQRWHHAKPRAGNGSARGGARHRSQLRDGRTQACAGVCGTHRWSSWLRQIR